MNINAIGGFLRKKVDGSFSYGQKEINKCIAVLGVNKRKKNNDVWYVEEGLVAIEFIGGAADEFNEAVALDTYVIITYEPDTRENDNRYFTSLKGKSFDIPNGKKSKSAEKADDKKFKEMDDDDLPF